MAEWKKHVSYNYNQYQGYSFVCQTTQNQDQNPSIWSDTGVTDYNSEATPTYTTAANTASPPGSPDTCNPVSGQQCYRGSGLVYVSNTHTGRLLLAGPYRTEDVGEQVRWTRRDSAAASDSDAHTSPDSWSSSSSREVSFPQPDPSTWTEKHMEGVMMGRSPDSTEGVSSSLMDQPSNSVVTQNVGHPTPSDVPLHDSKKCNTTLNNPQTKARVAFTESQMNALVHRFSIQRYLTPAEMKDLAEKTGLTYKQVKTWFQNRRMKLRRHQKDNSWVLERYAHNKSVTYHGPAFNSMVQHYPGEGLPHYNQNVMEAAFKKAPQNMAYYFATVGSATGGYPTWSPNPSQAAAPRAVGWSMTPDFNTNKFVHNSNFENRDEELVGSQNKLNSPVLHDVNE